MNNSQIPLTRHQRHRLQTRKRLIQAAVELVLEKGFETVTIQDITDRADIGRGTFYIHFKDKEEVIWIAIQDLCLELEQAAHQKYKDNIPDQQEYYGLLYIFHQVEKHRDLFRLCFSARGTASLSERVCDLLADIIMYDIQHQPGLRDPNSDVPIEIIAQMMTGLITRMISWWLSTSNEYTSEQMAGMIYEVLLQRKPPVKVIG